VDGSNRIVVFLQMAGRISRKLKKRMGQYGLDYISEQLKDLKQWKYA
jgi:hypothetical protein